ncbi:hypothetical protein [Microbacterium sp. NPDC087589]|uniref:hypothetical protein n=1 Tax=Microbacterium sp. NPDC087589 TaxID=3364191 RepID=UPI0037F64C8A
MTHDPYAPYGREAKLYPAKGAGWHPTLGRIEDANALGVTLSYPNPVNSRYRTVSTFPLTSIDRIEYPATDAEVRAAAADLQAEYADALHDTQTTNRLEVIATASEEIAECNGQHTWRGIREAGAA